jgi:hypothetical protein
MGSVMGSIINKKILSIFKFLDINQQKVRRLWTSHQRCTTKHNQRDKIVPIIKNAGGSYNITVTAK